MQSPQAIKIKYYDIDFYCFTNNTIRGHIRDFCLDSSEEGITSNNKLWVRSLNEKNNTNIGKDQGI